MSIGRCFDTKVANRLPPHLCRSIKHENQSFDRTWFTSFTLPPWQYFPLILCILWSLHEWCSWCIQTSLVDVGQEHLQSVCNSFANNTNSFALVNKNFAVIKSLSEICYHPVLGRHTTLVLFLCVPLLCYLATVQGGGVLHHVQMWKRTSLHNNLPATRLNATTTTFNLTVELAVSSSTHERRSDLRTWMMEKTIIIIIKTLQHPHLRLFEQICAELLGMAGFHKYPRQQVSQSTSQSVSESPAQDGLVVTSLKSSCTVNSTSKQ